MISPKTAGQNNTPRRSVCMLVYAFYESDNRVMRYAQALADRGDRVDVIALGAEPAHPAFEVIHGVNVHRIQRRERNEKSRYSYLGRMFRFCVKSSLVLGRLQLKYKYDLVHVHNVPDFLVFSAWLPRLLGAKVILDIHDILPEFFANKFHRPAASLQVKLLRLIEFVSARFASHVIISNHLWYDKITARSVPRERCSVFINHVDLDIFNCRRTRAGGNFTMLYHGGLQWHQGLDIAIRAFAKIRAQAPEAVFHIHGGGNVKPQLESLVRELGLRERVVFFDSQPMRQIAAVVANADLGVVAKRADSFGNEAYSTKIMEFMAEGVPVIVSQTKIDSFYFDDSVVEFFESGNVDELAATMLRLIRDPKRREHLARNAGQYIARNNWGVKKQEYLNLVDSLICANRRPETALAANPAACELK